MPNGLWCAAVQTDTDSCAECKKYHDFKNYGNNDDGKCVWVPAEGSCLAKEQALLNPKFPFDEECAGS